MVKIVLPAPLTHAPLPRSPWEDFILLLKNQLMLTGRKIRHLPVGAWIGIILASVGVLSFLGFVGYMIYMAVATLPQITNQDARAFLSLVFMLGLVMQVFFGVTTAFVTLYMSDDLELLFVAPVSLRAVFAVKSLVIAGSNLFIIVIFTFLPGVFYGWFFGAHAVFYILVVIVAAGIWIMGTALAELLNLLVMRIVPPHRVREAVGFIGASAAIMIVLIFQLPNLLIAKGENIHIANWLIAQSESLRTMDVFPWGWGSLALADGAAGNFWGGFFWCLLLLIVGAAFFWLTFLLVERGFRRGWINLSQAAVKKRKKGSTDVEAPLKTEWDFADYFVSAGEKSPKRSASRGILAIAIKDLLYLKRDTREWFGYLIPLIIMLFFAGQFLFLPTDSTKSSAITVLIIYSIMFSGNLALQSFGREGEADWVLNSVPLAGWPVVWGKLLAAAVPTLLLMEALLIGTSLALGFSITMTIALAVGAILLTFGASAIGLFYSINNCRFNPENPQQRISLGASMVMYLVNLVFVIFLAWGLVYVFPPTELLAVVQVIPPVTFKFSFPELFIYLLYLFSRPFLWTPLFRIMLGVSTTLIIWALVFFSFMSFTVRQSSKGFRIQIVTQKKSRSNHEII